MRRTYGLSLSTVPYCTQSCSSFSSHWVGFHTIPWFWCIWGVPSEVRYAKIFFVNSRSRAPHLWLSGPGNPILGAWMTTGRTQVPSNRTELDVRRIWGEICNSLGKLHLWVGQLIIQIAAQKWEKRIQEHRLLPSHSSIIMVFTSRLRAPPNKTTKKPKNPFFSITLNLR